MKIKTFWALAGATTTLGYSHLSVAADESSVREIAVLEEVTVTAERFSTSLQSTPIAVTAVTADDLAERNITNVMEASEAVPGLLIIPGASSMARISMRGALQSERGIRANAVVGIYVDDVIQPRPDGALFDFFDIERLEVLRGPQGTLYGRNTTAGAIKMVTKQPSNYWTGAVEVGAGNLDARQGKFYVSGPLIDETLAFSLSGGVRQRDGYTYELETGNNVGDVDVRSGRAKLQYTPTEDLKVTLSVLAVDDTSDTAIPIQLTSLPGINNPYASPGRNLMVTETLSSYDRELSNTTASLNVSYTLSDTWSIESITGYGDLHTVDGGAAYVLSPAMITRHGGKLSLENEGRRRVIDNQFFTQEINAHFNGDRLRGVGGIYYFDEEGSDVRTDSILPVAALDNRQGTEASALFGQATYSITSDISVTAGLRYTRETQDYYSFQENTVQGQQVSSATWEAWTPKVGLDWQFTSDLLGYVSFTRGYRAGGFNARNPETNAWEPTPFGEEYVDSYEVGTKFTSADGRFRLNTAAFAAIYGDMQLIQYQSATNTTYTSNAGGAEVLGLELEPTWQVTDSLQLYGSLSLNDAKYTKDFQCQSVYGPAIECGDKKVKGVVPVTALAAFKYSPALPLPGQLSINGSWNFIDKQYHTVDNNTPLDQSEARDLYNASIMWVSDDDRVNVSLDGRNLANKHYVLSSVYTRHATQPATSVFVGAPREVMLRVGLNF